MTFIYAVTFESLTEPPHTVRGEVSASRTSTGARMAMLDASRRSTAVVGPL
jgi:hypothetical protein